MAFVAPAALPRPSPPLSRAPARSPPRLPRGRARRPARMLVLEVKSPGQMDEVLKAADGSLVVVDYSTSWCGPCKAIAPVFEEMSEKHADVVFVKVMGDLSPETNELMKREGIRAVPAFHFWKEEKRVKDFTGARTEELEKAINNLK